MASRFALDTFGPEDVYRALSLAQQAEAQRRLRDEADRQYEMQRQAHDERRADRLEKQQSADALANAFHPLVDRGSEPAISQSDALQQAWAPLNIASLGFGQGSSYAPSSASDALKSMVSRTQAALAPPLPPSASLQAAGGPPPMPGSNMVFPPMDITASPSYDVPNEPGMRGGPPLPQQASAPQLPPMPDYGALDTALAPKPKGPSYEDVRRIAAVYGLEGMRAISEQYHKDNTREQNLTLGQAKLGEKERAEGYKADQTHDARIAAIEEARQNHKAQHEDRMKAIEARLQAARLHRGAGAGLKSLKLLNDELPSLTTEAKDADQRAQKYEQLAAAEADQIGPMRTDTGPDSLGIGMVTKTHGGVAENSTKATQMMAVVGKYHAMAEEARTESREKYRKAEEIRQAVQSAAGMRAAPARRAPGGGDLSAGAQQFMGIATGAGKSGAEARALARKLAERAGQIDVAKELQ